MAKYRAVADTLLSHECRVVKAGEEFETTFPTLPDGPQMRLGANIEEIVTKTRKAKVEAEPEAEAAEVQV